MVECKAGSINDEPNLHVETIALSQSKTAKTGEPSQAIDITSEKRSTMPPNR